MKKFFLLMVVAIGMHSCGKHDANREPIPINYFNFGDILFPDYACPDTVVVMNPAGMNKGMGLIEQGIIDATDWEIDSVIHANCQIISKNKIPNQ